MRVLLSSLLLAVSLAAQNPPALDPAKVFDYDASKPLNVKMGNTIGRRRCSTTSVWKIRFRTPTCCGSSKNTLASPLSAKG
jgi:hypothetical protein